MKLIVLAAGQGTRLRPLTDDRPKCLVEVAGRPMLDWQIASAREAGVEDIVIVRGYRAEMIDRPDVRYGVNPLYDSSNMVETLWCAENEFDQGFILAYGDIIYEPRVIKALLDDDHPVSVVLDRGWQSYWTQRFKNVLDDAETLKLKENGCISEIGQVPRSLDEIEAQYVGLLAFRNDGIKQLRETYEYARWDGEKGINPLRGQRPFKKMGLRQNLWVNSEELKAEREGRNQRRRS